MESKFVFSLNSPFRSLNIINRCVIDDLQLWLDTDATCAVHDVQLHSQRHICSKHVSEEKFEDRNDEHWEVLSSITLIASKHKLSHNIPLKKHILIPRSRHQHFFTAVHRLKVSPDQSPLFSLGPVICTYIYEVNKCRLLHHQIKVSYTTQTHSYTPLSLLLEILAHTNYQV